MLKTFKEFLKEEDGAEMVEWVIIIALIVIVAIVGIRLVGEAVKNKATTIVDEIDA